MAPAIGDDSFLFFFLLTAILVKPFPTRIYVPRIWGRPSKNLKTLPQIQGISMHGVQKRASDSGHIYARCAEPCLRSRAYLCTVCIILPLIQGIFMHGVQNHASDSRHIYARGAETCLRFRAYLCTVCRTLPQIQGISMHGVHNLPPVLGLIFTELKQHN